MGEPSRLEAAVAASKDVGKLALYFGCWNRSGHYLHYPNGHEVRNPKFDEPGFVWTLSLLDTALLKNGAHFDICDGKVFWTVGGSPLWYAFFWWDRSVDSRRGSNSGFYVRGFGWPEEQAAFDYACTQFPKIVARQKNPLILQAKL